jgi:autotransporter passenger strand-loop-strand repeat protein
MSSSLAGSGSSTSVTYQFSVTAGQTLTGQVVGAGTSMVVLAAGLAVDTQVASGGLVFVSSKGLASTTVTSAGGVEYVGGSGVEQGGVISGLGLDIISSGGRASGLTVHPGAVAVVLNGGVASSLNVASGGLLVVISGGTVSATTGPGNVVSSNTVVLIASGSASGQGSSTSGLILLSGQAEYVCAGGSAAATAVGSGQLQSVVGGSVSGTLLSGGVQYVYAGLASATHVQSGTQDVFGGSVVSSVIGSGGIEVVCGGVVSGTQVTSATQTISGGIVNATTLASGASQYILNGSASGTLLGSDCTQVIASGVVTGTVVGSAASQVVSGGHVFSTVVNSGGTQDISGGAVTATKVFGGGSQIVSGGVVSNSLLIDGAAEIVSSGASAAGTQTIEAGSVIASAGATFTGTVAFIGGGGTLTIGAPASFGAIVTGFETNDTIDLTSLAFTGSGSASLNGDQLSVTQGAVTQVVDIVPTTAQVDSYFIVASDGDGGTDVTPCFAAGTRIATARGPVPVEALRVGELVRLAEGGTAPLRWLGYRRVAPRRHPRPADMQPVRVAAHAFGLGRPGRVVRLSPDHAVFVDGVLIPVRYLLNGATLRQEDVAAVTYWHVELPAHAVLLAEGLPCESFLDTGNRAAFANGGDVVQQHPAFARAIWDRAGCAPLVTEGPVRGAVYRRLLAQAFALGWRTEDAGAGAVMWRSPPRTRAM